MSTDAELSDSLVKVIRKHRIAKKLSMYQLAKLSGLDKSALGKLEAGMRSPSVETAHKIAKALKVPLSKLIAEAEKM
jgi:transcriptional regulator with XRE-family HTH domain